MTRKAAPPQAEDNSRRAELVRTAARLFRDQGYERTTVRDLGNAVGLQSGSLFYHFRNKEEILVAVMALGITSTTEQLAAALEVAKTPYDKVSALIHVHLNSLLGENQAALEVMLYEWRSVSAEQKPGLIVLRDRYEALWQSALDEAAAAGVVGQDTRLLRRMVLGSLHWSVQWFRRDGGDSVDALAERMLKLVIGPRPQAISHVPYNDIAALRAAVSARTCAIVVEPVQGEGGVLPASREYLQAARELADAHGALLIFDEVQTGVGRTGALYAYQQYGVTPDILTSAKGLGGGFPIGAMLTTTEIAKHFSVGTHGTTYGGNPLACAVAEAVIDTVNTAEVQANVTARAAQLRAGLEALNAELGLFAEVRGMGLLLGAVLNDHYAGRAGEVVAKAAEAGVIVLQAGPNVVRFAPSLVIGEDDVSEALGRLGSALQAFAG